MVISIREISRHDYTSPIRAKGESNSTKTLPGLRINVSLLENTPKCAYWDLALLWHDHRINGLLRTANEFHVTTLLASFDEAYGFQPALHLPEGQRPKPPQPQPRSFVLSADALPAASRSEVQALRADWRALHLRSRLDWRHRLPDTWKPTNFLHARPRRQKSA